jgi:hypothetical protein
VRVAAATLEFDGARERLAAERQALAADSAECDAAQAQVVPCAVCIACHSCVRGHEVWHGGVSSSYVPLQAEAEVAAAVQAATSAAKEHTQWQQHVRSLTAVLTVCAAAKCAC